MIDHKFWISVADRWVQVINKEAKEKLHEDVLDVIKLAGADKKNDVQDLLDYLEGFDDGLDDL